jgi:hypothetical protein
MHARLQPALTFGHVFGTELLYSPRASPNACAWLPRDEAVLDMLTGNQLTILGGMPILCAAGVSSPEALGLLHDAGFQVPAAPRRYRNGADYLRLLSDVSRSGRKIVVQHVHPITELAPDSCWVPPTTLSFLNNKGNLAELVDAPHRPARRIVTTTRLMAGLSPADLPVVVKAVTDESTGGGIDVLICGSSEELGRAAAYFGVCGRVVVEDFIKITRNLCLNYAVTAEGRITYLGCAEQVSDAQGKYHGNWIDAESEAPAVAVEVGVRVVRAGLVRGYWGWVGVDMAIGEDGRVLVFDLNFRLNGSTAALLLAESVRISLGSRVIRLRSWKGRCTYREMLNAAYTAMGKGLLLPLNSYDPVTGGQPHAPPRMAGLIIGGSRDEVKEREGELAALGLEP